MKFMTSNSNYADFAIARKKAKGVRTSSPNVNPFAGDRGPTVPDSKSYGNLTKEKIRPFGPKQNRGVKLDKKVAPGKMQRALRQVGRFAMKNKVGVGLAAAGALGAAGVAGVRKMRSDKGKKRGGYSG